LSQIGVNIGPLLAGAESSGSRSVSRTEAGAGRHHRMFVLFENAIQVGDVVTAPLPVRSSRLSVRTIWLRGGDGTYAVIRLTR